ncbi:MAG: ChaN family lipoprotein [Acidobacteriota bacterium]
MSGGEPDLEIRAQKAAVRALKRSIGTFDRHGRRKYIRDFLGDFSRYTEPASYDDLVVRGFRSDVVFVGDYHALVSSQMFCARFLDDLARRSNRLVLAMEMVFGRQQRVLDEFMSGAIEDDEFRRRIRYDDEWGYEWSGFAAILATARRYGIQVVGIDSEPRSEFRLIRRRDRYAARRIAEIFLHDERAKAVVFIGESHLARNHLPLKLAQELANRQMEKRSLTIVQNIDSLYWQRAESGESSRDIVRVEGSRYCVFNASPITKYEAYRQTIERWKSQSDDDDVDLAPTVHRMIDTILRFLQIHPERRIVDRRDGLTVRLPDTYPEVYVHEGPPFIRDMMQRYGLEEERIEQVLGHLSRSGSCFVPRINAIFVGSFNLTHAGEEASHFINYALRGELYESWNGGARLEHDRFYISVMDEAIGYFGSKLIDPARNHFFETDFYRLYKKDPQVVEEKTGYSFDEFTAIIDFILLHKRFEKEYAKRDAVPAELLAGIRSRGSRFRILTHELGYFLGQQIYDGYQRGLVTHEAIVELYARRWDETSSALSAYLDWAARLAPLGST